MAKVQEITNRNQINKPLSTADFILRTGNRAMNIQRQLGSQLDIAGKRDMIKKTLQKKHNLSLQEANAIIALARAINEFEAGSANIMDIKLD